MVLPLHWKRWCRNARDSLLRQQPSAERTNNLLTYEDFTIGREFPLGPKTISKQEIIEFAQNYDPQPFHLDGDSQQAQLVGGLIASGWHTSSILMRMLCDAYLLDTQSQGSGGLDEVKWTLPVRPGDTLSGAAKVLSRRISKSKPELGIVGFEYKLENQNGEQVIHVTGMGMINVAGDNEVAS